MQNRLTIKDIARLSGVGKSTVSRVLNNEGSVSPQTRERVEAVIRQQGFTPSKSARAKLRAARATSEPSGARRRSRPRSTPVHRSSASST